VKGSLAAAWRGDEKREEETTKLTRDTKEPDAFLGALCALRGSSRDMPAMRCSKTRQLAQRPLDLPDASRRTPLAG